MHAHLLHAVVSWQVSRPHPLRQLLLELLQQQCHRWPGRHVLFSYIVQQEAMSE